MSLESTLWHTAALLLAQVELMLYYTLVRLPGLDASPRNFWLWSPQVMLVKGNRTSEDREPGIFGLKQTETCSPLHKYPHRYSTTPSQSVITTSTGVRWMYVLKT